MRKTIFFLYVLTASLALLSLKLATTSGLPINLTSSGIDFNLNAYTIGGIFLYGVSFLLYIYLLSKFSLGFIVPATTALIYVLVFLASFILFNETFTAAKIFGILLILGGLILLNINSGGTREDASPLAT